MEINHLLLVLIIVLLYLEKTNCVSRFAGPKDAKSVARQVRKKLPPAKPSQPSSAPAPTLSYAAPIDVPAPPPLTYIETGSGLGITDRNVFYGQQELPIKNVQNNLNYVPSAIDSTIGRAGTIINYGPSAIDSTIGGAGTQGIGY